MYKYIKKISLLAIVFVVLMSAYSHFFAYKGYADMEEVPYDYNRSSLIADLNDGNEVEESEFFPSRYLANIFGENSLLLIRGGLYHYEQDIYVIAFIENGYNTANFGLYFYVYNPNSITIDTDDFRNKVQFSSCGSEEDVFRTQYSKYRLELLDTACDNVYMKFKVKGFNMPESSNRYYGVSGIEFRVLTSSGLGGGDNELAKPAPSSGVYETKEYTVGSVYRCYTVDKVTTISRKPLSTIAVDVTHVYYRTDDSEKGKGWSNQLSACYFSLPKEYSFENNLYGRLSEIKAEFDLEYTKPILVLNNRQVYQQFLSMRGVQINDLDIDGKDFGFRTYIGTDDWCHLTGEYVPLDMYTNTYVYGVGYNFENKGPFDYNYNHFQWCYFYYHLLDSLFWVLPDYTADFDDEDYYLSHERLESYYNLFHKRYDLVEDSSYFENNNISLCGFDRGYNLHTYSISAEPEEGSILGYDLTFDAHGFWAGIAEFFGFNQTSTVTGIAPLVQVEYADRLLSDEEFSEKYLVAKYQVAGLKEELVSAGNEREVWLFRYDCSEYYGAKAEVFFMGDTYDGLVCQAPVYFDWDILSFTFEQNDITTQTLKKTIIPVVHDPEDVFPDLTRSENDFPADGCGSADYVTLLKWLLLFGLGVAVWYGITKGIRFIKRGAKYEKEKKKR